jgi:murein hydrolase activator
VNRIALPTLLLFMAAWMGGALATENINAEQLRQRIGELQQELENSSESKSEAADALRESERAISHSNRKIGELTQQQREASRSLAQLQQQSTRLEHELQGQRAQLAALIYQQYLGGKQEYLQLLLESSNPSETARIQQYYSYIAHDRAAWLATLRGNFSRMNTLIDLARQKSAEIAALQREEEQQKRLLEQDLRAHQQVLSKISVQLKQQSRDVERLQHNEGHLSQLVGKLGSLHAEANSRPFAKRRGKLALPVKGKIANQFGARRLDNGMPWKGWYLRAARGLPVKAVASGRVVFADWLRGYGNLLIVDHGMGYMSLYGYNETLYKQMGDSVEYGDVIASVGKSGGNTDSGLYFELRHEGKPLDPRLWVAAR